MADIVLLYSITDNTIIYKTDTVALHKKKQTSKADYLNPPPPPISASNRARD